MARHCIALSSMLTLRGLPGPVAILLLACAGGKDGDGKPGEGDADADADTDCVDDDGDGYGDGCAAGPDCDDDAADCSVECDDLDGDGTAECRQDPGDAVLLYDGNNGGGYDIHVDDLEALYADAGSSVVVSETFPADLADRYGLVLVLSPMAGFPDPTPAAALVARGGTLVVATEHSGFGDHEGATEFLAAVGSTLASIDASNGGPQPLTVTPVDGVTDGVSALELFYCADVDLGAGTALGVREDGEPGIGWEAVGRGQVVLVPDGSFFGYSLDEVDNSRLLLNLTP